MTPLTLLRLGVIGIHTLLLGAALSCAQSFTFEFKSDEQSGIAPSETGPVSQASWDWDVASNPLENKEGREIKSGSLFFALFPSKPLVRLDLAASDYLNWTGDGLSDGGGGFNSDYEFISFTFGREVQIDELDLASLTGSDQISLLKDTSVVATYLGSEVVDSILSPSVRVAANETLILRRDVGNFGFDAMTISAVPVPEPATLFLSGIVSIACIWRFRKKRHRGIRAPDASGSLK